MRFLFCDNSDSHDRSPAEKVFLTQRAPESLTDGLEKAEEEYERIQRRHQIPFALTIVRYLAFGIGMLVFAGFFKADVSLAQGYHNAPLLYWAGGICLVAAGALFLAEKYLERRNHNSEGLKAGQKRVNAAGKTIRDYLAVPKNAVKADILAFSYRGGEEQFNLRSAALNCEFSLFRHNQDVCLFNGSNVFSFPKSELSGIRLVNHGVAVLNWNKNDSPAQKRFQRCGVMLRNREATGLRFFCALDILRSGETYSLLFPAYELPAIEDLTGLTAPELPPVSIAEKVKKKGAVVKKTPDDGKVRPLFYWKPPKEDVGFWFTPMSDVEFQSRHPVLYVVLVVIGIAVFLLPAILFCIPAFKIPGADQNGWMLLGVVGGVAVGIGLFNIVAAWLHQYLGHIMTIICFAVGGAMMAASWILIQ